MNFLHPVSISGRRGFTLPEVCVAVAVFSIGLAALACGADAFVRLAAAERTRVQSATQAVARMESLIVGAPPCGDTLRMSPLPPSLRRALSGAHLYYAETGDSLQRFRRIVRCR